MSFKKISGEGLYRMTSNEAGINAVPEPRRTTVLVIDDDELVRQSLGAILGVYGLSVLFAPNGQLGIQVFQRHHWQIDIVLLDFSLPDLPGELVFKKMRELNREMPVIVMSGHAESSVLAKFLGESKILFLSKPSPINELIAKINQLLGKGSS